MYIYIFVERLLALALGERHHSTFRKHNLILNKMHTHIIYSYIGLTQLRTFREQNLILNTMHTHINVYS